MKADNHTHENHFLLQFWNITILMGNYFQKEKKKEILPFYNLDKQRLMTQEPVWNWTLGII